MDKNKDPRQPRFFMAKVMEIAERAVDEMICEDDRPDDRWGFSDIPELIMDFWDQYDGEETEYFEELPLRSDIIELVYKILDPSLAYVNDCVYDPRWKPILLLPSQRMPGVLPLFRF